METSELVLPVSLALVDHKIELSGEFVADSWT